MQLFSQSHAWGLEITGFGRPMGLGVGGRGELLVTDMDCHALFRFDAGLRQCQCHDGSPGGWGDFTPLIPGRTARRPSQTPGGWNGPHGVVEDGLGRLLVTCYYTPWVAALNRDGAAEVLIGGDFLKGPATTRIDARGRILVAEYALNLLLVFDPQGAYLGRLGFEVGVGALELDPGRAGVPAATAAGAFDRPHMAMGTPDGGWVVADTWNHRLQRFSAQGHFIGCLVDGRGWQVQVQETGVAVDHGLSCPVAVDANRTGQCLVTAWGRNQVLFLDAQGRLVPLPLPFDLNKPYDARFFRDGLVIADSHHGRILIIDNLNSLLNQSEAVL